MPIVTASRPLERANLTAACSADSHQVKYSGPGHYGRLVRCQPARQAPFRRDILIWN